MHDPMVMIYSNLFFTIWHVDPEADGSDDSCGWFNPKITKQDKEIVDDMIDWEKNFPYYSSPYMPLTVVNPVYDFNQMLAGDCLAHVAWAWMHVAWEKDRRTRLTTSEWWAVVNLSANPNDNLRAILSDSEEAAESRIARFFYCIIKAYSRHHLPWWKHPRWHIYHWEIQVHFIQKLKRRLFSRCAHCGVHFSWGYHPISNGNTKNSRWFGGEKNCYHHDCYDRAFKSSVSPPLIANTISE